VLDTRTFMKYREQLGFARLEGVLAASQMMNPDWLEGCLEPLTRSATKKADETLLFIELCCEENSSLRLVCGQRDVQYIGITKDGELPETARRLSEQIEELKKSRRVEKIHCHASCLPLPVEAQSARQQADGAGSDSGWNQNDPFSRTDKWIGNPPQPSFEKWRDRESEVLNRAQYVADLSAWASQASLQFGTEILQASRSATLIHAFMEGVDIQEDWHSGWVETSQDGYGTGEVAYFAGCPWVRLHPVETLDRNTDEVEDVHVSRGALADPPQEAVAVSHFVHRVLFGLGEIEEKEQVDIVLESDSSSALQLIGAVDLPRRSRHIDIKLTWLKERVSSNEVQLRHRAGTQNVADLFTKQDTQVGAWSEADEKALQVMLARRSQGIVPPCVTQTAGSMTDAAKRRLVDFESDEFEEVPFPGSPKDRVATLAAMDVTIADEGKVKHLLPKGVDSFVEWSRTVIAFGKLKDSGLSYKEIVADPKHEAYVAWCKRLKGSTGPAGDFGDFLQAYEMIFDGRLGDGGYYSESTVRRVLK
ncbi:unnamed protein product, partial [Durusdinium trenchii]